MDLDKEIENCKALQFEAREEKNTWLDGYYQGAIELLETLKENTYDPELKDNLPDRMNELSKKVLNKFPNVALTIATEECAELIQAVTKLRRGRTSNTDNLAEEIADVMIVIHWLKHKYWVTDEQIETWLDHKIKRCNERLDNGSFR